MKTRPSRILITLSVALLAAAFARAEVNEDAHAHKVQATDPAAALSPELRQLLVKEMRLIDDGMGELVSALSAGKWESVETIAGKVQHSFILKQALTDHQIHELHEKLPPEFVRMDVRFHRTAGKLADVARQRDAELSAFYYSRLVDGCVSCHAAFAVERFPGLASDASGEHRH